MTENKEKRTAVYLPIFLAVAIVLGILIGMAVNKRPQMVNGNLLLLPKSDKLQNVVKYVEEEYVDSVSMKKITEEAIVSFLKELDPHTTYIPAEDLQAVNEPLEGNFSGIGVQFNMQNDTVVVINTIPHGPSALVGIMAGDRIVKVNDSIVAGKKLGSEAIVKKLKGPRGTKVNVTIKRLGYKKELSFEITRDRIPLYSVDIAYMMDKTTGYIKISQFARTTKDEFISAVNKLHAQGMKKIILDLRDNGGGYLDAAIGVADQFLSNGKLIVYTKGRAKPREEFRATDDGVCESDKVVILIDEYTASASEILAGAIQDNDRGTIIGRRSFGKGLVQEQLPLADGSAIRLTIARYYTPTGRCIQKSYKNGIESYYRDISNRFKRGEFENKDSIHFNDSLKYKTPGGKIVYGGGGIMPDIFVPLDTVGNTKFYDDVNNMGLIYRFAFTYSDHNRNNLKKFTNVNELQKYLAKQNLLNDFVAYTEKKGLKPEAKEVKFSGKLLEVELEANVARDIMDNAGFFPIMRKIDNTLEVALKEIEK